MRFAVARLLCLKSQKWYEPQSVEEKWYRYWMEQKCFVADPHSRKPAYSIVIPPPNVTGTLTLGHVLNNTIQDILARLARMKGMKFSGCRALTMQASPRRPWSSGPCAKRA